MNKQKWKNPRIPLTVLTLKLAEEVGEISRELTDASHVDGNLGVENYNDTEIQRLLTEANDAVFLATEIQSRLIAEERQRVGKA